MRLPCVELTAERNNDRVVISNVGQTAAVSVRVIPAKANDALLTADNNGILFPGESGSIQVETIPAGYSPGLQVEAFNSDVISIPGQ